MAIEIIKLFVFSNLIVIVCKYILVKLLRGIAKKLKLKSKTIGNITGIATSIPELLTVSFSASSGFIDTSLYNILSSNIINSIQYLLTVFLNKNQKKLSNKAIKIDLLLTSLTIFIPILTIILKLETNAWIVPIFLIMFYIFYKISKNAHKLYIKPTAESKADENRKDLKIKKTIFLEVIGVILVGVVLYILGEFLSETLEILCTTLNVPEIITGVLLGVITSIPEFITFIEAQRHHKDKSTNEGIVEATSNLLFSNLLNLFIIQAIGIVIFLIVK